MQPIFETERLLLRPFELTDASKVQELAGDIEVAKTTLSIPYPYPDGAAESWISGCKERSQEGVGFTYAIVSKDNHSLIGCMSINVSKSHKRGELAYWLGKPFWGHGYATEAARRLVAFGFKELDLNKVWAAAMTKNPASSNVMKKVGMKLEGQFQQHILKWNEFEDLVFYGLTKRDYTDSIL
ncbi:GNAT family N-acetyltransferase [Paenibacillus eucommiae]|uniref:RimJ/RimL family protein N-acetyltransferase n=1 Tax=Paenibacillus eucommiae TaxID=1355755 RepID=A0ABS4IX22_9BACL|nr:GNAT family N-acetyltransferase [Paenibacillus eucommiae]MBP1992142.1 RimJ/RimL family protein N-acetyltransferase [Paenibacillus eucommiae]